MMDFDKTKVENILYGIGIDHSNRFSIFLDSIYKFTDKEFWYGFSSAYSSTDNLFHLKEKIKILFNENRHRPFQEYFMTDEERVYFKKLPRKIKIYRGMTIAEFESRDFGISWTLSKDVADFFEYKYIRNEATHKLPKMVHSQVVDKGRCFGYLNERKEQEIVLI